MRTFQILLLSVLLTLFGATTGGAVNGPTNPTDGAICVDSDNARIPLSTRGTWQPVGCYNVCNTIADAAYDDDFCNEFDLGAVGIPDIIVFEYEEDPDNANCSEASPAPTVTITTGPVTIGTTPNLAGIPSYNIDSSAVVLDQVANRVVVITKDAMLDRFLYFAVADTDGCTDVDVRMFLYNHKSGLF
jgi:hypothetical protein